MRVDVELRIVRVAHVDDIRVDVELRVLRVAHVDDAVVLQGSPYSFSRLLPLLFSCSFPFCLPFQTTFRYFCP